MHNIYKHVACKPVSMRCCALQRAQRGTPRNSLTNGAGTNGYRCAPYQFELETQRPNAVKLGEKESAQLYLLVCALLLLCGEGGEGAIQWRGRGQLLLLRRSRTPPDYSDSSRRILKVDHMRQRVRTGRDPATVEAAAAREVEEEEHEAASAVGHTLSRCGVGGSLRLPRREQFSLMSEGGLRVSASQLVLVVLLALVLLRRGRRPWACAG